MTAPRAATEQRSLTAAAVRRAKARLLRDLADEVEALAGIAHQQALAAIQRAQGRARTPDEQIEAGGAGGLSQAAEGAYARVANLLRERAAIVAKYPMEGHR